MSHKLLERQLARFFGDTSTPPELAQFLAAVGEAYVAADADRRLLERSLELTSNELLRTNDELRLQLSTLRGVFDSVPLAVVLGDVVGDELHEVASNQAAQHMRFDLRAGDWAAICREARAAGHPRRHERERRCADGVEHHVVVIAPVAGRPDRYCIVIEDVTERKALEARLRAADRMASMGTVAAGVAHEINNPLAYVIGNLHHIEERIAAITGGTGDLLDALSDVREGADRVRRIVRDLRAFARSEEERRERVNVIPVLESCFGMAGNEIRHRARLVRDYQGSQPVEGDPGRLAQLFLNLIVNAAHAIPEGAADQNEIRVTVRVEAPGWLVVEVRDSGVGVPEAIRERIFEPFFTTKPAGIGTGLGLAICASIVQGMGGQLGLESDVGKGSTFSVRLPSEDADEQLATPARAATARPLPRETSAKPRARILVVDDEVAMGRLMGRLLRDYEVTALTSSAEAMARLAGGERFDLVLCDLMMPDITGMDLHAELSERIPDQAQRFIFMTGGTFTVRGNTFVDEHKNRCISKPIDPALLKLLIADVLGPT